MEAFGLQRSQLPPGFRFHPTDPELIVHYLRKKVSSSLTAATSIIADIDLYKFNPWDLPDKAFFGEGEWFFFTPRDRKYPNGARPNRAAASGYWKATGTDKPILETGGSRCLGVKKALVFYQGRPPKGTKTDWVMHEYRLLDDNQKHKGSMRLDDWVLCRVRQKGVVPAETEEKSSPDVRSTDQNNVKQSDVKERNNNLFDWSDYQLLNCLINPKDDGGVSSTSDFSSLDDVVSNEAASDQSQPSPVSLMLDSIKRTLSFGALNEMMLSPSNKRLHFSDTINEQLSPTGSVSIEHFFPEYLYDHMYMA